MSKLLAMMMNKKYTRLEYIETTGTQWINTGITASQDLRVKTKIYSKSTNNQSVFCSRSSQRSNNFALLLVNGYFRPCYDTEYSNSNKTFSINTLYDIDFNKNNFYVDGELIKTFTYNTFSNDVSMKIANSINTGEIYYIGRIYPIQIYKNDILVCDLIPVIRNSDNEIGMLDRVSGIFRTNRGTGKFRVPNEVGYTVVGSPTIVDGVVSGFGSSDYLKITQSVSLGSNFEIKTKVVTGSDVTSQRVIFSGLTGQYINFSIQDGKTQQNIGNGTSWEITQSSQTFGKTTIATNTTYYLRFTFDGSAYKLYLSTDNINWILDWKYESVNVIPSCQYVWGISRSLSSVAVFNGSIDIANSYIKQNNKLWFNGQPAE